jgi:nucleoside-diphosphate-sugar epimerase
MINLKGKRILVTGGTGSIGGHLVERLVIDCQAEVRVLVRDFARASRIARFPIQMVPGDISDPAAVHQAMEGCDIVFHLAYGNSGGSALQKRDTTEGTKNVLQAALEHKVERVVHVSTISVYGKTRDGDLDESAPRQYSGEVYADSKLKAEKLAFHYFRKYGVPVSIIQPTIVYGPFIRGWTVTIINRLKNERVVLPDEGNGLCNAVYVDDVVEAMLLAATRDEAVGEAFLISAEEPVTWREFYGAYEQMLGTASLLLASQSEIKALNGRYKREHGTINQILTVLRSPDVLLWIIELPAIKNLIAITRSVIPVSQLRRLMNRIILSDTSGRPSKLLEEKPYKPLAGLQDWEFRARTRVRIDKAQRLLGYQPRFKLEEGMKLTDMWARYANLV